MNARLLESSLSTFEAKSRHAKASSDAAEVVKAIRMQPTSLLGVSAGLATWLYCCDKTS
jgi:hypothetical protein